MSVLIIVESMFGNTYAIAEQVAAGMRAASPHTEIEVVRIEEAPADPPASVTLLLLGGPTHAFGMSREQTRADAIRRGAAGAQQRVGMREWIERATVRTDLPVVTFDTHVRLKIIPGSAAKSAALELLERGFLQARRGLTFYVDDTPGPLAPDELGRARAWGAELARAL